jgi:hypothetical protein
MSNEAIFTIGPPQPVEDSRKLPAITAEDEAGFVHGADLGYDHPDNIDSDLAGVDADPQTEAEDDEALPGEDELDDLVAEVDPNDVDGVGFDDADLEEPLAIADRLGDHPQAGGP